jgi:hypothetical protein
LPSEAQAGRAASVNAHASVVATCRDRVSSEVMIDMMTALGAYRNPRTAGHASAGLRARGLHDATAGRMLGHVPLPVVVASSGP